ncbi:acetylcholinesterase-like [Drosophila erecta]|uniref:GG25040 n=1 Tax=Drosophila erecta TaxID=7220 RepID=B3NYQ1_DROER|nr:acetylcholinesterase-like [Drosophila erecta]
MVMLLSNRQLPPSAATRTRRKVPPTGRRSGWAWSSLLALVLLDIYVSRCSAAGISYSSNSGNLSTSQKSPASVNNGGLVLIGSSSATSSSVPSLSLTSSSSAGLSSPGSSSSSSSSATSSSGSNGSRSGRPTSNTSNSNSNSNYSPNHDQLPAQLSSRIINTRNGAISGVIVQLDGRHLDPVEAYRGIPYASPPVGNLRFMPPVSAAMWSGVKKADRFSPVCPQRLPDIHNETAALERMPKGRLEYLKRLLPYLQNQSEDCLYLNIYVPIQAKTEKNDTTMSGD